MAEGSGGGGKGQTGDAPSPPVGKNGVQPSPSGYPLSLFQDAPDPKYLCSHCKTLLQVALQSHCGHRYCAACLAWIAGNNSKPICQSCKEDNPNIIGEESLLSVEKAFSDAAINKEISELAVYCGIPGCSWTGILKNLEDHESMCEYAPIPCHTGCGQVVIRKQFEHHLQNCCVKANLHSSCNQTGNEHQNLTVVSTREEGCRFSRIGCSFKGTTEDRKVHEADAAGIHLKLLLKHAKELKAQLCPAGDGADAWLTADKVLTNICFDVTPQRPLEVDFLSGLPLFEEKSHRHTLLRSTQGVSLLESKLQVFENIASVLSKEMAASRQKFVAVRGQRGLDQDMIRGLELKIADLQRCLVQKDAALSKLEERVRLSEQVSYDGIFLWKITDVHRKCYEAVCGKMYSFQSPAFYTSRYGYKLCMRIYLNGEGRGKGSHVSLFLVLLRGDYDALLQWPFAHKVTVMLLSQNNTEHLVNMIQPDPESPSFQRPVAEMNEASGFPKFIPLAKLQSPKYAYIKEGTIFLRCITQASP